MTDHSASLVNKCLLATPSIKDPIFASSLIYLCEHSENGCMGLVVNHQSNQVLQDIFDQLDIECRNESISDQPVYIGGPVKIEQGFVLHSSEASWQGTAGISDDISLTSSLDILIDIAANKGPEKFLVTLGYSGWASGQLESELQENSWLTSVSTTDLLFSVDSDSRWQCAFDSLGFDLANLSPVSGNA